jgi:hypothetical protein
MSSWSTNAEILSTQMNFVVVIHMISSLAEPAILEAD